MSKADANMNQNRIVPIVLLVAIVLGAFAALVPLVFAAVTGPTTVIYEVAGDADGIHEVGETVGIKAIFGGTWWNISSVTIDIIDVANSQVVHGRTWNTGMSEYKAQWVASHVGTFVVVVYYIENGVFASFRSGPFDVR